MRERNRFVVAATLLLFGSPAMGQLTVTSHVLNGSWSLSAADGSDSNTYNFDSLTPLNVHESSTVTYSPIPGIDLSVTNNVNIDTEVHANGFGLSGSLTLDEPSAPIYDYMQSHQYDVTVSFDLSQATEVRVSGSLLHDPHIEPSLGSVALLNGTEFHFDQQAPFNELISEAVGPVGSNPASVDIDSTFFLPAGSYSVSIASFSSLVGGPGNALVGVNTAWDLNIDVVPAPAALLFGPFGLVLASRRRR